MKTFRTVRLAAALAVVTGSCLFFAGGASADSSAYTINKVSDYGGEPSLMATPDGSLYAASLLAPQTYRSTDGGQTWTAGANAAYSSTGDDCLGTDQTSAVYMCNLTILGPGKALLQGDVYKSTNHGNTWGHGAGISQAVPQSGSDPCGTSCSPAGVDRDWIDAYIPKTTDDPAQSNTNEAVVALMWHDFYGPSHIWVNISTDGGATFGAPIDVLAHPAANPTAAAQDSLALADTACSTVPSAVKIEKSGPNPGRIYVAWIASDPSAGATGCNLSQAQAFHDLFVAWSDDNGQTWTPQLAYDAGLFHDTSTPFVGFTLDDQGNPYFGFAANSPKYLPATCAGPQNPQTPDCEYDMWVVWSPDGGSNWNSGGGLVPGSAGMAYQVNADPGTHWFPAIAAGGPGQVAVTYLRTSHVIATDPNGKQHPGGCWQPCTNTDAWNLYTAEADVSDGKGGALASPAWTVAQVTQSPMHIGDICNLGIACPGDTTGIDQLPGNRHLADFISTVITSDGCQHVVYADDHTTNVVDSANQVAGCFSASPSTNVPEAAWTALLGVVALVMMFGVAAVRRRGAAGRT